MRTSTHVRGIQVFACKGSIGLRLSSTFSLKKASARLQYAYESCHNIWPAVAIFHHTDSLSVTTFCRPFSQERTALTVLAAKCPRIIVAITYFPFTIVKQTCSLVLKHLRSMALPSMPTPSLLSAHLLLSAYFL